MVSSSNVLIPTRSPLPVAGLNSITLERSIDIVLSSEWCRCKDTAYYAFGKFKEFSALNSTFSSPYNKNEPRQIKEIKKYLKKWEGEKKNLILITHYSIIAAITNATPDSGEIVIANKNLNVIGTIKTN